LHKDITIDEIVDKIGWSIDKEDEGREEENGGICDLIF
jgi:hypothetical protein